MRGHQFSRRLFWPVIALVALLSISFAPLSFQPSSYAASSAKKLDLAKLFTARPMWNKAQKAGSAGIPPCLKEAVPPRCYTPQQLRNAYSIQPLIDAGITGKGHTIVIIGGSSSTSIRDDLHLYDQLYGLKDPKLNVIAPFGMPAFDPNAYVEAALDIQTSHAMAPDATIDLVVNDMSQAQTPLQFLQILLKATKYAVDHNLGDVISQSFGAGESCVDAAYLQEEQAVFKAAKAKNITVLASAGDFGAAAIECKGDQFFLGKGVSVPGSDPLLTSVGGTTLDVTLKGGKYVGETTWNEWQIGAGATGGGFSDVFARPDYQNGVPGVKGKRGVPDVAFDGDPLTGVPVVVSVFGGTLIIPIGGTSVGSPAWAGIVALLNQKAGHRLGFLNDDFYNIGLSNQGKKAFHDITQGDNTVFVFDENGNQITVEGFSARSGWDAVTGVGTPKVDGLADLLSK